VLLLATRCLTCKTLAGIPSMASAAKGMTAAEEVFGIRRLVVIGNIHL
jgi:hypothetical protein